jgi:hypothetical protein
MKRIKTTLVYVLASLLFLLLLAAANMYGTRNARADVAAYRPPVTAIDYVQTWWAWQPDWRKRRMCDYYKVRADRLRVRRAVIHGRIMLFGDRTTWRVLKHEVLDNC